MILNENSIYSIYCSELWKCYLILKKGIFNALKLNCDLKQQKRCDPIIYADQYRYKIKFKNTKNNNNIFNLMKKRTFHFYYNWNNQCHKQRSQLRHQTIFQTSKIDFLWCFSYTNFIPCDLFRNIFFFHESNKFQTFEYNSYIWCYDISIWWGN